MPLSRVKRLACLVTFFMVANSATADTVFGFSGSPQSFVGNGERHVVTPSDGYQMGVVLEFNNVIHFHAIGYNSVYNPWRSELPPDFTPSPDDPSSWWEVAVGVGSGKLPHVGKFRDPSTPPDFSDPFVSFVGNYRATNQTSGFFVVKELMFDSATGEIASFALNFIVFEENDVEKRDVGFIRFNSAVPIPAAISAVPEASTSLLLVAGLAVVVVLRRRQTRQGIREV